MRLYSNVEIVKKNTVNTNILVFTTAVLLLYGVVNIGSFVLCLFNLLVTEFYN